MTPWKQSQKAMPSRKGWYRAALIYGLCSMLGKARIVEQASTTLLFHTNLMWCPGIAFVYMKYFGTAAQRQETITSLMGVALLISPVGKTRKPKEGLKQNRSGQKTTLRGSNPYKSQGRCQGPKANAKGKTDKCIKGSEDCNNPSQTGVTANQGKLCRLRLASVKYSPS